MQNQRNIYVNAFPSSLQKYIPKYASASANLISKTNNFLVHVGATSNVRLVEFKRQAVYVKDARQVYSWTHRTQQLDKFRRLS